LKTQRLLAGSEVILSTEVVMAEQRERLDILRSPE
jgi:hypothetical protein